MYVCLKTDTAAAAVISVNAVDINDAFVGLNQHASGCSLLHK